jgi:hypothetical protein
MTPQRIVIQTRRPSRDHSDPGAVEVGHWVVIGDRVHLCDENGAKTGTSCAFASIVITVSRAS